MVYEIIPIYLCRKSSPKTTLNNYCWWFRNSANHVRLVGYPFIYDRFYTSQVVVCLPSTVGAPFFIAHFGLEASPKKSTLGTLWNSVRRGLTGSSQIVLWVFLTAQRIKNSKIPKNPPKSADSDVFPKKNRSFLSPTTLLKLFVSEFLYPLLFVLVFFPKIRTDSIISSVQGNHLFNCSGCPQEAPNVVRCQWPLAPETLVDWGAAMKSFSLAAHRSRLIGLPSFIWEMVGWAPITLDLCAAEWCDYVTNLVSTVCTLVYHGISRNLSYSEISYVVANGHWGERSAICLWVLKISRKSRVWDSFLEP